MLNFIQPSTRPRSSIKEVLRDLGDDAVLLCYEKPGQFCHRHLVAQWLKVDLQATNLIALPNGLNILARNNAVILFTKPDDRKEITNSPIDATTTLYCEGMTVLSVEGSKLYKVRMS
jgi:hypothetical protein